MSGSIFAALLAMEVHSDLEADEIRMPDRSRLRVALSTIAPVNAYRRASLSNLSKKAAQQPLFPLR